MLNFIINISAQEGFEILNKKKVIIPFQQINNLLFVKAKVNGVNLTFLLDSGVSETLLFSLNNNEINFNEVEKVRFTGLGGSDFIEGLKSNHNNFIFDKNFFDKNHEIYIILDEKFNFSSHVGIPVNGILGYHFFKNHPIQIDFENKKITVFRDANVLAKKTKKFENLPLNIELKKPYVFAEIKMAKEFRSAKMLIDLGNSDAIWLFPTKIPNFNYNRPNIDDFLGRGFNGDIYGKRSRINAIKIGENILQKPIVSMPSAESVQSMNFVEGRIGSIGADILKRFTIIFDYPNHQFYFKKTKNIDKNFTFNMSGLDVKHDGTKWEKDLVQVDLPKNKENKSSNEGIEVYNTTSELQYKFTLKPIYSIAGVRENSPGFLAQLKEGDILIEINGKKTSEMSLQEINELFSSEENREITLVITRKSLSYTKKIVLKDPIPYQEN